MNPDLTSLRLFLACAELGSITKAARAEHLVVSAVSKRLAELERKAGVRFFDRSQKGLELTAAGRTFRLRASAAIGHLDRLFEDVGPYAMGERGEVRIVSNTSGLVRKLPALLREFMHAYPAVQVLLEERRSHLVVQALGRGKADIGIFSSHVAAPGIDTFAFDSVDLVLAVPDGHRFSARRTLRIADTSGETWIGLYRGEPLRDYLDKATAKTDNPILPRLEVASPDCVRSLVKEGLGIAVMPDHAVTPYAQALGIRAVSIGEAWACFALSVGVRNLPRLAKPAGALLRYLVGDSIIPPLHPNRGQRGPTSRSRSKESA